MELFTDAFLDFCAKLRLRPRQLTTPHLGPVCFLVLFMQLHLTSCEQSLDSRVVPVSAALSGLPRVSIDYRRSTNRCTALFSLSVSIPLFPPFVQHSAVRSGVPNFLFSQPCSAPHLVSQTVCSTSVNNHVPAMISLSIHVLIIIFELQWSNYACKYEIV